MRKKQKPIIFATNTLQKASSELMKKMKDKSIELQQEKGENSSKRKIKKNDAKKQSILYHRIEKTRIFALHFDTCPFDTL